MIAVVIVMALLLVVLVVLVVFRRRRQRADGTHGHPGKGAARSSNPNDSASAVVLNQLYTTADMERSLAARASAAEPPPAAAPHEPMRPRAATKSVGGGHLQTSSTDCPDAPSPAAGTDGLYDGGAQPEYAVVDRPAYDGATGDYAGINYAAVNLKPGADESDGNLYAEVADVGGPDLL